MQKLLLRLLMLLLLLLLLLLLILLLLMLMLLLLLLLLPLLLLLSVVLSFPSHLMFSMKVLSFVCQGHLEDLLVTAAQPVVACLCGRQQIFQTVNGGRR
jgi:hypothetical protein